MTRLIDEEEAFNVLSAYYKHRYYEQDEALLDALSRVPTAVPVRHGKWEMKPDPFGFFDEVPVCSECGCTTKMREKTKYCPNCGADMRGEE